MKKSDARRCANTRALVRSSDKKMFGYRKCGIMEKSSNVEKRENAVSKASSKPVCARSCLGPGILSLLRAVVVPTRSPYIPSSLRIE